MPAIVVSICPPGDLTWSTICRHLSFGMEKAMAPHSSTLAWKIPWTEDPGRPQSMGSLRVGHNWATSLFHFLALKKEMATHSSVLAWRIPGTEEPGGLPSMGSHRVGHDWGDLAAAALWKWWSKVWVPDSLALTKRGSGSTKLMYNPVQTHSQVL